MNVNADTRRKIDAIRAIVPDFQMAIRKVPGDENRRLISGHAVDALGRPWELADYEDAAPDVFDRVVDKWHDKIVVRGERLEDTPS
jgi:hypothetical protein